MIQVAYEIRKPKAVVTLKHSGLRSDTVFYNLDKCTNGIRKAVLSLLKHLLCLTYCYYFLNADASTFKNTLFTLSWEVN